MHRTISLNPFKQGLLNYFFFQKKRQRFNKMQNDIRKDVMLCENDHEGGGEKILQLLKGHKKEM